MAKKINKKDIANLLEQWSKEYSVYVPAPDPKATKMAKWDGKDTGFLDWYRNTVVPSKSIFFPLLEEMFRYQNDGNGYQVNIEPLDSEKKLVFAIRPCDAGALAMLNTAFQDGYEDPYFLQRRNNALLVGMTCTRPYDSCFCTSLGGGPAESKNVDIMLTDLGDELLIEDITDKGKELTGKTSGLAEAGEVDINKAKVTAENATKKISRQVNVQDITRKLQNINEDKEFWEKAAAKCISCGVCTFFCPTCYCFDITDNKRKGEIRRQRCWDSCQFSVYTQMPAENPRNEKWRRVRQKVCHKYEFYPMNYETIACTGCGRCIRLCPVNWDITKVINSIPDKVTTVESK